MIQIHCDRIEKMPHESSTSTGIKKIFPGVYYDSIPVINAHLFWFAHHCLMVVF